MLCCVPRYFRRNPKETNISWEDTVQFVPPINEGIVIKVHDGDTFTLAAKLPYEKSPLYRFSVRLNGINCQMIDLPIETPSFMTLKTSSKLVLIL